MRNQSYRGIYHGWFIVAAAMFIALVSMGPRVGFGVFVIPMSDDFGWSRSAISLAGTVAAIVGGCTQPVLGRIFDIVGGRKLMLTGLSVFAVSTLLLAFTNHIIYLIIVFGVLMAVGGSAGTMNTAAALVSKWFHGWFDLSAVHCFYNADSGLEKYVDDPGGDSFVLGSSNGISYYQE
jgi:MFS family permease